MAFTDAQTRALSIIPHATGPFSFVGSAWIITDILRDRTRWAKPYHRLLFAMAFFDALSSIALGLSTLPIPSGSSGVYAPMGTQQTCSAQGFFIQANIASPLYNFCLSLYYLLLVRYSISETRIAHRFEPWMHGCTVTFGLGTSFVCLGLGVFNNSNLWCWISALPKGCEQSYNNGGETTCTRGDNAEIFRWAFFFAPLWASIVGSMVAMFMLWKSVRTQEDKVAKWTEEYVRSSAKEELHGCAGESMNADKDGAGKRENGSKMVSFSTSVISKFRASIAKSSAWSSRASSTRSSGVPISRNDEASRSRNCGASNTRNNEALTSRNDGKSSALHSPSNNSLPEIKLKRDQSKRIHRKSNMVMWQAFRYVSVFWLTWLFGSINRLLQLAGRNVFWVMVLHALFVPLQGFLNFLVYKYPIYYRWKEKRRKNREAKITQQQEEMGMVCGASTNKTSVAFTKRFSGMSMERSKRPSEVSDHNSRISEENIPEA